MFLISKINKISSNWSLIITLGYLHYDGNTEKL